MKRQITNVITHGGMNWCREATLECGHIIDTTKWLYEPTPGGYVEHCKGCGSMLSFDDDLGRAGDFMDRITPVERDLNPNSMNMLATEFCRLRKDVEADMLGKLDNFENAWHEKMKEGYLYGEDALEQVRFGWEIAVEMLKKSKE